MHRDGTVFLTIPQQELQSTDFYKKIGCDGAFGHPKLKSMTVDNIVLREFYPDKEGAQKLQQLREIEWAFFTQ